MIRTTIRQAIILARKDTKVLFRDRLGVAFSFLFPFLFVIGFTLALGGQGPSDDPLELVLTTLETDGISNELIDAFATADQGQVVVMAYDEALQAMEDDLINGYIVFPADFTESLINGNPTSLEVVSTGDGSGPDVALVGFANSLAEPFNEIHVVAGAISEATGTNFPLIAQTAFETGLMDQGFSGTVEIDIEQVGDVEPWNASNFTLPGYLTMFVFFAAALSAEGIARERRNHTLERLISNGVRREAIIIGKLMGTAFLGLLQISVLWTVGILAFRIDLGASPVAVILISVLMVVASSSFGVLIASFIQEAKSASLAGVLASLTLAPIGGCWWPLFITPDWMQTLAKITPHGWTNIGFNKLMLYGAEFGDVAAEMVALVMFGVLFAAIALWRFRTSSA